MRLYTKICTLGCGAQCVKMAEHRAVCGYFKKPCRHCGEDKNRDHEKYCEFMILKCTTCNREFFRNEGYDKLCTDCSYMNIRTCQYCSFKTKYMGIHRKPCMVCFKPCVNCLCKKTFVWYYRGEEFSILSDSLENARKYLSIYLRNNCYSTNLDSILVRIRMDAPRIKSSSISMPSAMFHDRYMLDIPETPRVTTPEPVLTVKELVQIHEQIIKERKKK